MRHRSPFLGGRSLFLLGTQIALQEEVRNTGIRNQVIAKPQPFNL